VKKLFICLLLSYQFFLYSCGTTQIKYPASSNNNTTAVTIVNNTQFDLEIHDESQIIPRHAEKKVTLPAFLGELNDGYRIIYRVPLLGDIVLKLQRPENIIIKNDQSIAVIETADFYSGLCFIILKNNGKQTISLKTGGDYLNSLVGVSPNKFSLSPYLSPGNTYLYELKPGSNGLSIETDQYRSISFPSIIAGSGFIYTFIFDGNEVIPTDARHFSEIGKTAPLAVEFKGDYFLEFEIEQLKRALASGLEASSLPFYPISSSESLLFENRVFHTLQITLNTQVIPAQPPVNRELFRGEMSLTLLRKDKPLKNSDAKRFTEMNRQLVLQIASGFLSDLSWCQSLFSEAVR
jgi:hypothetical protein